MSYTAENIGAALKWSEHLSPQRITTFARITKDRMLDENESVKVLILVNDHCQKGDFPWTVLKTDMTPQSALVWYALADSGIIHIDIEALTNKDFPSFAVKPGYVKKGFSPFPYTDVVREKKEKPSMPLAKEVCDAFIKAQAPRLKKQVNTEKWIKEFDMLLRVDLVSVSDALMVCRALPYFKKNNDFCWNEVVLSPAKFRKHFNALMLQAAKTEIPKEKEVRSTSGI